MNMTKRLLFAAVLAAICAIPLSAGIIIQDWATTIISPDYEIDGICYLITEDGELAVTAKTTIEDRAIGAYAPRLAAQSATDTSSEEAEWIPYEGDVIVPEEVYIEELDKTLPVERVICYAFCNCPNLISVTLPETVKVIEESAFANCSELESVKLSPNISSLSVDMFLRCSSLKALEIPESVTKVEKSAFYDCGIESLTFSEKIHDISVYAFRGASALKRVTLPVGSPADINVYGGGDELYEEYLLPVVINKECVLYVPEEAVDAFKSRMRWSRFSKIQAIGTDAIRGVEAATADDAAPAYNLFGQPVANPRQGDIVIRNHKKLIVR